MAKRKRSLYGFPFDPLIEEDITWEDEYSSGDYDSDDVHSSVASYCTDNESTDEEDDTRPTCTVAVASVPGDALDEALATGERLEDNDSEDLSETDSVTGIIYVVTCMAHGFFIQLRFSVQINQRASAMSKKMRTWRWK